MSGKQSLLFNALGFNCSEVFREVIRDPHYEEIKY